MKFVVLYSFSVLKSCTVGTVRICKNVLEVIRSMSGASFKVYKTTESAPDGTYAAKITDSKMELTDSKNYDVKEVSFDNKYIVVFEPDGNYAYLGTGWCRTADLRNLDDYSNKSFLLISEKEAPKEWTVAVVDQKEGILDWGDAVNVEILRP